MVLTDCPKMSVRNYHFLLCNNSEERGSYVSLILWLSCLCVSPVDVVMQEQISTLNTKHSGILQLRFMLLYLKLRITCYYLRKVPS
jgi:hypothetical protein